MWPGVAARTIDAVTFDDIPVLVVGAGPAGLAAAIELTRHDIPCLLVERRTLLSSHPRATALSLRSMELVRAWGLESGVRARSVDVDWRMLESETLADAAAGTTIAVGYPNPEQSRMVSPTAPACVAQDDLEPLLLEHLRAAPRARVALGTELSGIFAGSDGARVSLRDVRTGALRAVHARYVVAADGARSAVRRALGIPLIGPDDLMEGATTLFRAPLWDVVGEHRHVLYYVTHPTTPAVFLPAGPSDRWLVGFQDGGADAPEERRAATLIRLAAGVPDLPVRVERIRSFSAAAQLAERWRSGRVFLAGDAAHRVTPRGGMGLNIALHDGYDIGWRLGWVLRDWAGPQLLDGYEAERRPVAEYIAARSADPGGSRRAAEQEVRADLGGRIAHVWAGERSTIDLLGPGLTLFAARDEPAWESAAGSLAARVPVAVRLLDPVAARAVGAPGGGRCSPGPTARRSACCRPAPTRCHRCVPRSPRSPPEPLGSLARRGQASFTPSDLRHEECRRGGDREQQQRDTRRKRQAAVREEHERHAERRGDRGRDAGCAPGSRLGRLHRGRSSPRALERAELVGPLVEAAAQHEPEQQRERRDQDERADRQRDEQRDHRRIARRGLLDGQPRQQLRLLSERPAGDDRANRHGRRPARGLQPPACDEQHRRGAGRDRADDAGEACARGHAVEDALGVGLQHEQAGKRERARAGARRERAAAEPLDEIAAPGAGGVRGQPDGGQVGTRRDRQDADEHRRRVQPGVDRVARRVAERDALGRDAADRGSERERRQDRGHAEQRAEDLLLARTRHGAAHGVAGPAQDDPQRGGEQRHVERREDRAERARISGPDDDEHEDQPDVVRLPHRAHGVVGVIAQRPPPLTRQQHVPEPRAEVGAAQHHVRRHADERDQQRQLSEPHRPRPARAARARAAAAARPSPRRASRR